MNRARKLVLFLLYIHGLSGNDIIFLLLLLLHLAKLLRRSSLLLLLLSLLLSAKQSPFADPQNGNFVDHHYYHYNINNDTFYIYQHTLFDLLKSIKRKSIKSVPI